MNQAIEKARDSFEQFIDIYQKQNPSEYGFTVKYPFLLEDESHEHMWVSELEINDGSIIGILNNDPVYTDKVKYGDSIKMNPAIISDWMYYRDGKLQGGYTIKVLLAQMSKRERKKMEKQFGIED